MEARPVDITRKQGLGTAPLSIDRNVSAEYFEKEREKIFKHVWLEVGRIEDVPNAGDFLVKEIDVLKTSVIVVKGRDGQIRGFHNMCKHRGNKVVRTGIEFGNCKGFSCGFHGWTYDLTGKLVIIPDEDQFFDVDKASNGLTPIPLEVWEGFIFVSTEPKTDLRGYLGEIADRFDGYFDNARRISSYRANVKANWKVVIDAFVEAYHAPYLHGKAFPDQFTWEGNEFAHLLGFETFGPHRMLSIQGNREHNPGPLEKALLPYTSSMVVSLAAADKDGDSLPIGVNPTRDPYWAFDIYMLFPTFYLAPFRTFHFVTYHFWPISVDETVWQTEHYMFAPQNAGEMLGQEYSKYFARDVQREDLITLENTQTMLRSGAMTEMLLSDQEVGVRHGYQVVEDMVNS